ncbi:MAG: ABC transporter permease [Candidatus Bathyarchaeota archaeon]|nr:ABC transporter permease [Candidatus Bathyarchaeota archaeon]
MTLRTYIISRILLTIPMIFILLTMVFIVVRVLPGDPVLLHFEKAENPEAMEEMRRELGLDKPLWIQYFDYLSGLLRGDLGKSMAPGFYPVAQQIFSAFPATLELAIFSMIIAVLIGIFLGVEAAKAYNKPKDHAIRIFGIVTYAIPVFFLGMIFQITLGVGLHLLPVGLRKSPTMDVPVGLNIGGINLSTGLYTVDSLLEGNIYKFVESLRYLVLPSLTLGLVLSGVFIRLTRSNMLETLRLDFVTAAKARGLKERVVTYGYALRNAFLPVLTMMGLQFATLLGGAILTETTFSWPGLGRYIVDRINFRDYTAIQGAIVVFGIFVSIVSLVVDLLYAYLDPRIRL